MVYENASKKTILQGFRLYAAKAVRHLAWTADKEEILVSFSNVRSTTIALQKSGILLHCDCSAGPEGERCPHLVCALLTLVNLLKPTVFRMTSDDLPYRNALLAGLFPNGDPRPAVEAAETVPPVGSPRTRPAAPKTVPMRMPEGRERRFREKAPLFEIVFEASEDGFSYHVARDNELVSSDGTCEDLPFELRRLVGPLKWYEDRQLLLRRFLIASRNTYPLVFQSGARRHRVRWVETLFYATWTELDARGETVSVTRRCSLGEDNPAVVLGDFAFDLEGGRVWYVQENQGWALWETLREALAADSTVHQGKERATLRVGVDEFKRTSLCLTRGERDRFLRMDRLKVNGERWLAVPEEKAGYRLSVQEAEEGYRLTAQCVVEGTHFPAMNGPLSLLKALQDDRMPRSLRTRKGKEALMEAYLEGVLEKRESSLALILWKYMSRAGLRRTLPGTAWSIVREQIHLLARSDLRLFLTENGWALVPLDKEKEILLYSIPYALFGLHLFEGPGGEAMVVARELFVDRLRDLHRRLEEHGIDLTFNDQPVLPVTWEFAIDATNADFDWFELRPEIRCDGKSIEKHVWEQALRSRGLVLHDGALTVLDPSSLAKLAAVLSLGRSDHKREIVAVERLRILDLFHLRKQGVAVRLSPDDEATLARLAGFTGIEEKVLPAGLVAKLRPYQKEGYDWLCFLYEHRFGACLADDMGLGKTLQALALLAGIKEQKVGNNGGRPTFLVVVPPSLLFNWEREIERFCPALKVYVYRGKGRSTRFDGHDVVLTSYALVRLDIDRLKDIPFSVIVFDEVQAVKNILADTTGAVRRLKGRFKLALTGTPVENHVGEYYSIMDLVLPGLLGDYKAFQQQAKHEATTFLPTVVERTKPFLLRRTKERILKELPPRIEQDVYLPLTEKQKKFYNRTVEEVRSVIDKAYGTRTRSQARIIALTALMKLRQICLTPELLVPGHREGSPKIDFLREKLEELSSESHSALVFSQFTSFLDIVENEIDFDGTRLCRLDGGTPVAQRKRIVEAFQGSEGPAVFLLSLKAGGQGLNLTKASYVFHLDPWWNPAVESQASDRAHRIGQKNTVIVTRLLMSHTVEEKMMQLKRKKLALYRALLESPEKGGPTAITREDFDFLLS
jgi:non-specific serine/threonine protein kinase